MSYYEQHRLELNGQPLSGWTLHLELAVAVALALYRLEDKRCTIVTMYQPDGERFERNLENRAIRGDLTRWLDMERQRFSRYPHLLGQLEAERLEASEEL